jgi:phosphoribosylformimino-5-aminoimidazole carboxamide ribotide isomerase
MKIIPAIDILDGKCVRLLRGNFDDVTIYSNSPLEQVRKFKDAGFSIYISLIWTLHSLERIKTYLLLSP